MDRAAHFAGSLAIKSGISVKPMQHVGKRHHRRRRRGRGGGHHRQLFRRVRRPINGHS
jgi:hypothetical protein